MKQFNTILYSLILLPLTLSAQTTRHPLTDNKLQTQVDSVINQAATIYMQDSNAIGISIGVSRKGINYTYNYGEAKKGTGILPSADNFYNIGSVAKTFVATILAQAVVENKLNLDDDIRKFLPGHYPNLEYKGQPIRFVHLANHTSGLPGAIRIFSTSIQDSLRKLSITEQAKFYSLYNQDSLLADLYLVKPDTLPGTTFKYNSSAMMLLVLLLEKVYHQPYEQIVTAYLKSHFKMGDTKPFLSTIEIKRSVQGYDKNSKPQPFLNLKGFYIGPTMNSTIKDMLKFIQANLSENDQAIRLTHQRTYGKKNEGLALGWMIGNSNGEPYLYHEGNTKIGFNTICTLYPSDDLGIIIIVNETISQDKVGELENNIKKGLDNK